MRKLLYEHLIAYCKLPPHILCTYREFGSLRTNSVEWLVQQREEAGSMSSDNLVCLVSSDYPHTW